MQHFQPRSDTLKENIINLYLKIIDLVATGAYTAHLPA